MSGTELLCRSANNIAIKIIIVFFQIRKLVRQQAYLGAYDYLVKLFGPLKDSLFLSKRGYFQKHSRKRVL